MEPNILNSVLSLVSNSFDPGSKLDPKLREKLLKEAKTPWRGPLRTFGFALLASAFLGLAIMGLRTFSTGVVSSEDLIIQIGAILGLGGILWVDSRRER